MDVKCSHFTEYSDNLDNWCKMSLSLDPESPKLLEATMSPALLMLAFTFTMANSSRNGGFIVSRVHCKPMNQSTYFK